MHQVLHIEWPAQWVSCPALHLKPILVHPHTPHSMHTHTPHSTQPHLTPCTHTHHTPPNHNSFHAHSHTTLHPTTPHSMHPHTPHSTQPHLTPCTLTHHTPPNHTSLHAPSHTTLHSTTPHSMHTHTPHSTQPHLTPYTLTLHSATHHYLLGVAQTHLHPSGTSPLPHSVLGGETCTSHQLSGGSGDGLVTAEMSSSSRHSTYVGDTTQGTQAHSSRQVKWQPAHTAACVH